MDNLNLLSPQDKLIVKKIKILNIIKRLSFLIISFLIILSTIFIFSDLILSSSVNSIENQIENELDLLRQKQILSTEDAIKQLNNQLIVVREIQNNYIKWTEFLSSFVDNLPNEITLKELKLINSSLNFEIKGLALDRESFLDFKDSITSWPMFIEINSPISNLSEKENINFTITGTISDDIYENKL